MRKELTAEIDLEAALFNLEQVSSRAGGLPVIAVVKADAYGHGALELSRAYESAGVGLLAVAFLSEARELREAGITAPILVLFDNVRPESYPELDLTPVIHDLGSARAFARLAPVLGHDIEVHLNVDTGMGREGLLGEGEVIEVLEMKGLRVVGLMSHFSEADLGDMEFVELQLKRFNAIRDTLAGRGVRPLCHIANSAALCAHTSSHLDAVRPGLVLYGVSPFTSNAEDERVPKVRPVMSVKARVLAVKKFPEGHPISYSRTFVTKRPTKAAILAMGYGDGYDRNYSNNADVLLRGKRAPVIGRVCMDLTLVDTTEIDSVSEGDEAVVLGTDGKETITAWELARNASTIPYEVLLSLGLRARRLCIGG